MGSPSVPRGTLEDFDECILRDRYLSDLLHSFLSLLLFSVPSFGQSSERPEGIVLPVATLGDVTETRRQIL